ncbi:CHAD domain-containing protein [Haloactinopolyspora alba]|uniref:CHAD domain-containing protein n=1 Tax=Haloactinopolyspora alba TaxID=648780 RepID=A0A2P8DK09_9ACTN|nr:CYTH and CHAD domain-containing protein [Haloactinopolyspora alba]PSK97562.1 CHAD domain-containing protein [Haloactinopolyspora alba]
MSPTDEPTQPRTSSAREVEQKFRVHGLFEMPDLSAIDGVASVDELGGVELTSAYYDTDDLRLAREGITCRRRTGDDTGDGTGDSDGDNGWQLKLPVASSGPGVRDEIRLPLDGTGTPPAQLTDVVRVIVRDAPVRLVSTLRTTRDRWLLTSADGPGAELVDDTVHVLDADGDVSARFRELELEQREHGIPVDSVTGALTTAGAVGGEFVAKVVRALGPGAAAEPEVPPPGTPRPKDPAAATLTAYLRRHVRALRAADIAYRLDPGDPETVHQLRVAARRLRSGLRTFRPLVDKTWAKQLRTELAWFARSLGELRENTVLLDRLERHSAGLPADLPADDVRALLAESLGARIGAANARALALLNSTRYLDLHERLVAAAHEAPTTAPADESARSSLPPLVAKSWERLAASCAQLHQDLPDDQWHEARLEAKRTRYAAEAVAPTLGGDAKAFAKRLEKLTDVLGEHQDAAQAAATARELASTAGASPDVAFALGVLASNERDHVDEARRRFAAVWPDARKPKWRRWLAS